MGVIEAQTDKAGRRQAKSPVNEHSHLEQAAHPEDGLRWVFWLCLAWFILAASTGAMIRYWMLAGFPAGLNYGNVRHAHSHLMYFGWVTPLLMALISGNLSRRLGGAIVSSFRRVIAVVLILSVTTYPAFFLWGYQPAQLGGKTIPISVILSGLNILAWYVFMGLYFHHTCGLSRRAPLRYWDASLVFLALASLGAWGRAALVSLHIDDVFITTAMVHLFLDLFADGWFLLAVLGLAYAAFPDLVKEPAGKEDWFIFLGLPLTFLLGVPVDLTPASLLAVHFRRLWPRLRRQPGSVWLIPALFLGLKAGLEAGVSITPLAVWGERMGLRIFYLHVFLLGFVSLSLLAAASNLWGETFIQRRAWMTVAVLALLASLLPLTGLWPKSWFGHWALAFAFLAATGPVLVALSWLAGRATPRAFSQKAARYIPW
jgi:hypothetical protein